MVCGCLSVVPAGAELYKEVKRASDSHIGVPSQCFVTRKASIGVPQARGRPQYCSNLVRCAALSDAPCMQDLLCSTAPTWCAAPLHNVRLQAMLWSCLLLC